MNDTIRYDDDAERASIFTVPVRRIRPHFWTFSIFFIATTVFHVYVHGIATETASWRDAPEAIMRASVSAAGFWIAVSPILVEGVAMVFAAMFRQKTRQEGREQGREEGQAVGREEANAAWREWNRRREEAIAEGKPFDEPAPDSRNGTGNESK
ncbi:MAG: hypothetical protein OXF79_30470 [Chloroflexi bacterium]|nr:hypothetical protein [Chloroflexota bacterium]